mmetsp:Transcript_10114/g.17077  ORF Transcript_10114/g.17077 Transcript_10114/m.17077 type:complete len:86 (-) Transcript_10114:399-656(-)
MMPQVHKFSQSPETAKFKTDFNWSVVMGQVQPLDGNQGDVFTSHPTLEGASESLPCQVLFYQKMVCKFTSLTTGKPKKCMAVVYC